VEQFTTVKGFTVEADMSKIKYEVAIGISKCGHASTSFEGKTSKKFPNPVTSSTISQPARLHDFWSNEQSSNEQL
jgi:hypothetical protein